MTERGRALIGVITTMVFLGLAVMLTLEQRYTVAGLLYVLTAFRAYVAVGQLRVAFGSDTDDDDEA